MTPSDMRAIQDIIENRKRHMPNDQQRLTQMARFGNQSSPNIDTAPNSEGNSLPSALVPSTGTVIRK